MRISSLVPLTVFFQYKITQNRKEINEHYAMKS